MSVINNAINGSILITTFTSSGTWTINARTKSVTIIGCNGGSGGGSGRKGTSGSTWGGGGGGGGGSLEYRLPIFLFGSSSYSVTIGGGGTGGAAQTTNATNGITGGDVGLTIVGNLKGAPATGNGGTGGRNSSSSSYGGTYYSGAGYSTGFAGFGGFGSNTNAGAPGTGGLYNAGGFYGTGGGGGAGGSTLQAYQGGASGAIYGSDLTTVLIAGSAGGIQSGTINGSDGTAGSTTTGLDGKFKAGTGGGGGGGYYSSGTGGAGGNGAVPGGAGGGGGGGISSSGNSGKGGDGAKGALFIIEYF